MEIKNLDNIWQTTSSDRINKLVKQIPEQNICRDYLSAIQADVFYQDPKKAILILSKKEFLKYKKQEFFVYRLAYLYARIGNNKKALHTLQNSTSEKVNIFKKCLKEIKTAFTMTKKMNEITNSDGVHGHFGVLETLIRNKKLNEGAEIGVFMGYHAEHLLQSCRNLSLNLIDPYKVIDGSGYDSWNNLRFNILFLKLRLSFLKYQRARFIRQTSSEAAKNFSNGKLDFVYIDADHRYLGVKKDLNIWGTKVRNGGIIAGHDYGNKQWPGVKLAVDEWAKKNKYIVKTPGNNVVWYIDK